MRPYPRFTPVPADTTGRRGDPQDGHDPYLQHRPGNHGCDHRAEPEAPLTQPSPPVPRPRATPPAPRTER
jgi:hypothetical protein